MNPEEDPPASPVPPAPNATGNERARKAERPDDVSTEVWADWLTHRKAKKATVSDTVVKGARAEAAKAGLTLEAFLAEWCTRGTQGLKGAWMQDDQQRSTGPPARRTTATERGIATIAALTGRNRNPPTTLRNDPRPEPPDDVVDVAARVVG